MTKKHSPKDIYTVGRSLSTGINQIPVAGSDGKKDYTRQPARPKKSKWKRLVSFVFLLLLIVSLVIVIWDVRNYSRASRKLFGTSNLLSALTTSTVKGADRGRVNIMVVGYSADDPGHAGANLTDSILIVSLSTTTNTGYMLSIPRDLYVPIPGFGRAKINEAYQDGQNDNFNEGGFPPGGAGLLEKTIAQTVGTQIDYYVVLDYAAVRDMTSAVGGITVNIQSSDPRGLYDPNFKLSEGGPLRLANGQQKIDNLTALRLSRARGSTAGSYGLAQSDFDRTKNQQAILAGIKNAIGWGILLNPTKNDPILTAAANNIRTDIAISEALPLFRLFHRIPELQMKSVTLRDINGQNLLVGYTTPYGQSALIPAMGLNDYSDIQSAINNLNQ